MPRLVSNPPNPWERASVEWLGPPPEARLQVYEEEARSAVARNESPDVPFRFSVNPYRGCAHACAYCYARPTHQHLGFGAGTDFDTRVVVKTNVAELLAVELARPSLRGRPLTFSGVTDCYQPLEASYELTRRCLEVCLARRSPVAIVTKSALVRRDAELLARLHEVAGATVFVSVPFADEEVGRRIEPGATTPARRFETLRALSELGVPTGVALAPLIPGLNDDQIPRILERAAEAGARTAFLTLLRLPAEVLPVFEERLREAFPLRADRVLSAVRDVRGGRTNDARFGSRMEGAGPRWEAIARLFEVHRRRFGLDREAGPVGRERPARPRQRGLFDEAG